MFFNSTYFMLQLLFNSLGQRHTRMQWSRSPVILHTPAQCSNQQCCSENVSTELSTVQGHIGPMLLLLHSWTSPAQCSNSNQCSSSLSSIVGWSAVHTAKEPAEAGCFRLSVCNWKAVAAVCNRWNGGISYSVTNLSLGWLRVTPLLWEKNSK